MCALVIQVGVVFGSNEVTTGGMALRFYASVRLEIRRSGQLKAEGEPHGSRIKVKVVKNKLAPPFGVVRLQAGREDHLPTFPREDAGKSRLMGPPHSRSCLLC